MDQDSPTTYQLLATSTVVEGIMRELIPSDVSSFLYATRMYYRIREGLVAEYTNIEREFMYTGRWVGDALINGDTIIVAGSGVYEFVRRCSLTPAQWRQEDAMSEIKLWLVLVPAGEHEPPPDVANSICEHCKWQRKEDKGTCYVNSDGHHMKLNPADTGDMWRRHNKVRDCKGEVCRSYTPCSRLILSPPELWPSCARVIKPSEWLTVPQHCNTRTTFLHVNDWACIDWVTLPMPGSAGDGMSPYDLIVDELGIHPRHKISVVPYIYLRKRPSARAAEVHISASVTSPLRSYDHRNRLINVQGIGPAYSGRNYFSLEF